MLSEAQERVFDMYFHFIESGQQRDALNVLKVIRCSLGKESADAPVIKLLLENPGMSITDIHKGTGMNERELSDILRGPEFTRQFTPRGCVYGIKGTNPNARYDDHSGGSMVARGEVQTPVI